MEALLRKDAGIPDMMDELWIKPKLLKNVEQIARHWKQTNERKVKARYVQARSEKKKRDFKAEREVTELVTRKVPFEYLAKDLYG